MADYEGSEDGELPETSPPGRDRVHASPVLTRQDRGGSAHRSGGGPVERPVDATGVSFVSSLFVSNPAFCDILDQERIIYY